jgi:hypothetical protein
MAGDTFCTNNYTLGSSIYSSDSIPVVKPRCRPTLPSSHCDFIIHTLARYTDRIFLIVHSLAGCLAILSAFGSHVRFLSVGEHP